MKNFKKMVLQTGECNKKEIRIGNLLDCFSNSGRFNESQSLLQLRWDRDVYTRDDARRWLGQGSMMDCM